MSTKALLRIRALERLGVIVRGQTAKSEYITRMDSAYTEVYAKLKKRDLAVWAEAGDSIPDEVTPSLILLMALNAIDDFGVSVARYKRIISQSGIDGGLAMREIQSIVTPKYESTDQPDDF